MHVLAMLGNIDKTDVYVLLGGLIIGILLFKVGQNGLLSIVGSDHFWQNLDKFMIVGLFLIVMGIAVHMIHHGSDAASTTWVENTAGQLLSALLAILGAKALQRNGDNGNSIGKSVSSDKSVVTTTHEVVTPVAGALDDLPTSVVEVPKPEVPIQVSITK